MGHLGRVRLLIFEIMFIKFSLESSISLLHLKPKCFTVKNLDKMIFKPPSPKKLTFSCTAQPQVVPNLQWRHL